MGLDGYCMKIKCQQVCMPVTHSGRNCANRDEAEGNALGRIFLRLRWDPLLLENGPHHDSQQGSEE